MSSVLKVIFFSLFFASVAHAQGIPGVGAPIAITANPSNSRPFETITLALQSFSVNIDQADITWYSNGKVIGKGKGLKEISVQAGALGSSKTISVRASTKEAGDISGSIVIRPAELSLVWQAGSYTPAFYKAKALLPFGGVYKVVALPEMIDSNGKKIDPRTLIYSWKKNDTLEQDVSGYGKDSFVSSQTSFVRQGDTISVDVSSPTDGFTTSGSVTIAPVVPEIHFYEDNPLYGIVSERELVRSVTLPNEEISIAAEPFFFSVSSKNNPVLNYSWTLNDATVQDFENKPSVVLRRADAAAGSSEIGLTITNSSKLLQGANQSLILRYE